MVAEPVRALRGALVRPGRLEPSQVQLVLEAHEGGSKPRFSIGEGVEHLPSSNMGAVVGRSPLVGELGEGVELQPDW